MSALTRAGHDSAPPLRVLLVGCGSISATWMRALGDVAGTELVGLCDTVGERANALADRFGQSVPIGRELIEMIARTGPDIVFDCTSPEAHPEVTVTSLRAGCHVLGEKPMALTMQQAALMVETAQETGKTYAVMQNRRFHPGLRALKAAVDSGVIGHVTGIHVYFQIAAHFADFRARMRHPLLLDMAIHTFDAVRYVSGSEARDVFCREWNPAGSWFEHDAAATAVFTLESGAAVTYTGSWCSEGLLTTWEGSWRVTGARGTITWDGASQLVAEIGEREGAGLIHRQVPVRVATPSAEPDHDGHRAVIEDFVTSVRAGTSPETACADNVKSLEMTLRAVESSERGVVVAFGGNVDG